MRPKELDDETRQALSARADDLKGLTLGVAKSLTADLEATLFFLEWNDNMREAIETYLGLRLRKELMTCVDSLFAASIASAEHGGGFKPEYWEDDDE